MLNLILYSTSFCHLCEQAQILIKPQLHANIVLQIVDIAKDETLLHLYGTKIPVLSAPEHRTELCWPFNAHTLQDFLQKLNAHTPF